MRRPFQVPAPDVIFLCHLNFLYRLLICAVQDSAYCTAVRLHPPLRPVSHVPPTQRVTFRAIHKLNVVKTGERNCQVSVDKQSHTAKLSQPKNILGNSPGYVTYQIYLFPSLTPLLHQIHPFILLWGSGRLI